VSGGEQKETMAVDYTKTCFVIMPFGEKTVTDDHGEPRAVNFDAIYENLFEPAIRQTRLPEGGTLEPQRTDKDFYSGDLSQETFEYLEYSRIALADITGLNANVLYELGVRHRARSTATIIFRQPGAKIPFDISQIKVFSYEYEPEDSARQSRDFISRVLADSLSHNRIDTNVQRALHVQREQRPLIESYLREAENAIRVRDHSTAIGAFRLAIQQDPENNFLHLRLGLLLKDSGRWADALEHFNTAIKMAPSYAEAWRERGVAEIKLSNKSPHTEARADGIASLRKAIELNPSDFVAHMLLGGALRDDGHALEALAEFERATELSGGHPHPLLNRLKLSAQLEGRLLIDDKTRLLLARAKRSLDAQVGSDPPYDPPWSFFDLAELHLYDGSLDKFTHFANKGVEHASHAWQVTEFADSLEMLIRGGVAVPELVDTVATLRSQSLSLEEDRGLSATITDAAAVVVELVGADALDFHVDVLAVKYAQQLYGVDAALVAVLSANGIDVREQLPITGATLIVDASAAVTAKDALFVGVEPLGRFDYQEIRRFSRSVLSTLAGERPETRHVGMTLHGRGFGLDEEECFRAEIAGILDAVSEGSFPARLNRISVIESDAQVRNRLHKVLRSVLPTGLISTAHAQSGQTTSLARAQAELGNVGHDSAGKPHVFVAMPFSEKYTDRYDYGISGAVKSVGLICERADLSQFTGDVLAWVRNRIESAALVVADLSDANPNVYLEVGYAWGCGIKTVLVAPKGRKLPFDVQQQRCLIFRNIKDLERLLTTELQGLLPELTSRRTLGVSKSSP
jgi:tetratricopeptide (TPR) repeat protein